MIFIKQTNLDNIKDTAISFLHLDISETPIPFMASHPFTDDWMVSFKNTSNHFPLEDLHNEDTLRKWRTTLSEKIYAADLLGIFSLLNKPYILNFLKFTHKELSPEDLGRILNYCWTKIEIISLDKSVSGRELIGMFKKADKRTLMDEDELSIYNSLPDIVTIYRGVTRFNNKKTKALSWSLDKGVAEWFANRFDTGTGEIWCLSVPKDRILCYFDNRNEKEVIVNLYGFSNEKT